MTEVIYEPIGIIHSPFKEPKGTPIQPKAGQGMKGTVVVFQEYVEGLADLEGFSHIILIYHFHLSKVSALKVIPFADNQPHGVFSTRAPGRPNSIGISIVRLVRIEENILYVKDLDIVEGTPLLDIKPYVPEIDDREIQHIGWLEKNVSKLTKLKDDGRFTE